MQLYYRETPTQVFSCEYGEIFKNTHIEEHQGQDIQERAK